MAASVMPEGKPTPEECAVAFSRIVSLLDGEFDPMRARRAGDTPTHDSVLAEASKTAAGMWHRLRTAE